MINGEKLNELSERDQKNIATSLLAIEERNAGILKFVSAYKTINQPVKVRLQEVNSADLMQSIESFMLVTDGIQLELSDELQGTLLLDLPLINQVLINLIKNAKEALTSTSEGKVQIHLRNEHDQAIIEVVDNGPGVSVDDIQQIFVPFFTTKADGSGVGLALSRKIVKAHHGTLMYQRKNEESHFIIQLPLGMEMNA